MARTRVPVEKRRRSQRACGFCRMAKKRCDGALPCYNCARRGRGASCAYAQEQGERGRELATGSDGSLLGASAGGVPNSYLAPDTHAPERAPSAYTQHLHPRMLRNGAAGERVYIGRSAALSFLQFLRATLKQYTGPSAFTESQTRHMMLEEGVVGAGPGEFSDDELDSHGKAALIKCFLQESSGFLGIFTDEDLSDLLGNSNQNFERPQSPSGGTTAPGTAWNHISKQPSLHLMLAIGARCRNRDDSDRKWSAIYFSRAKQSAFQDSLLEPSLDMIVSFILMAFYMFCACRRNTASLYLGIASRAATILGLHTPELDMTLARDVRDFRVRIWRSLRVLDLQCNAILGRPSSTANIQDRPASNNATDETGETHRMLSLAASFDLCSTMEVISRTLTRTDCALDEPTVENYLKTLQDWSRALPGELRRSIRKESHAGVPEWKHREETIGNVHVACGYYFAVILVTRPFLVATIIPKVQRFHGQVLTSGPSSPRLGPGPKADSGRMKGSMQKTHSFSRACVGAATILIQLCHDAATCDMLPDNMCILQSWIFEAGLVLGFFLLAPEPSDIDGDPKVSFAHARQILEKLSRLSPQARRYHELLFHFGDAVERYERQRRRVHPPSGPSYLEHILRPEVDADWGSSEHASGPVNVTAPTTDSRYMTPDKEMSEPCTVESGLDERFPWPQQIDMLFAPEINDELGMQLPWDEYVSQFTGDVATADSCSGVPWDPLGTNLNA